MSARERYLAAVAARGNSLHRLGSTPAPVEEKHRICARNVLRKAMPIGQALEGIGYSAKQAKKGMAVVRRSNALRMAFQEETELMERQKYQAPLTPSWEAMEPLIAKRLKNNIEKGKDSAVMSCKLAGSHKKLNLWTPENQTGIIILNLPQLPGSADTVPEEPE
jgi:hypothetical protein